MRGAKVQAQGNISFLFEATLVGGGNGLERGHLISQTTPAISLYQWLVLLQFTGIWHTSTISRHRYQKPVQPILLGEADLVSGMLFGFIIIVAS